MDDQGPAESNGAPDAGPTAEPSTLRRGGALLLGLLVLVLAAAFIVGEPSRVLLPTTPPPSPTVAALALAATLTPTAAPTATRLPSPSATATIQRATPTPLPTPTPAPTATPAGPGTLVLVRLDELGANDLYLMPFAPNAGEPTRLWPPGPDWRWAPTVSADGQWLAYSSGAPDRANVLVARRDGSDWRIVLPAGELNWGSPWWLADGRLVAGGTVGVTAELYVVGNEGGTPQRLTGLSGQVISVSIPSAPRAGGELAFSGLVNGVSRVLLLPAGAKEVRFVSPAGAQCYTPAFSPDGSLIAFAGALADGRAGMFVIAPDGSGLRQVVAGQPNAWLCCPAWSPDGAWLAYVGDIGLGVDADHGNLYVAPAAGGQPRRLTDDGRAYHWRPAWLP